MLGILFFHNNLKLSYCMIYYIATFFNKKAQFFYCDILKNKILKNYN